MIDPNVVQVVVVNSFMSGLLITLGCIVGVLPLVIVGALGQYLKERRNG